MVYLLSDEELPEGFRYPASFVRTVSSVPAPYFAPWWFLAEHPDLSREWLEMVREEYPSRVLIPFAKYDVYDDIACFDGTDCSGDPIVHFVHFAASPGWEGRGNVPNFDAWLEVAKRDSEEWRAERREVPSQ